MDLWTQFLNILSQVIMPSWNDLLQYMPLLFVGPDPADDRRARPFRGSTTRPSTGRGFRHR